MTRRPPNLDEAAPGALTSVRGELRGGLHAGREVEEKELEGQPDGREDGQHTVLYRLKPPRPAPVFARAADVLVLLAVDALRLGAARDDEPREAFVFFGASA